MQQFILNMENAINSDFKPRSVERSINLQEENIPQMMAICSNSATNKNRELS
jgi:hypothetical protein